MYSARFNEPTSISKDQNATLARRHPKLLQLVEAKGQTSVDESACHSNDTICCDLQILERRKLLLCMHEATVSTALLVHCETPFWIRANAHADAKTRIERAAVQLISDGETLSVNGGSTGETVPVFLPRLVRSLTPYPDASGAFIGIASTITRGAIFRAVLEGLAFRGASDRRRDGFSNINNLEKWRLLSRARLLAIPIALE